MKKMRLLIQALVSFSWSFQLSQQLDGLLGMLCADVAPADGAAIQQTLKHLEEKLKSVGEDIIILFNSAFFFLSICLLGEIKGSGYVVYPWLL